VPSKRRPAYLIFVHTPPTQILAKSAVSLLVTSLQESRPFLKVHRDVQPGGAHVPRDAGVTLTDPGGGHDALVGKGGRHPDVDDDGVRTRRLHLRQQGGAVTGLPDPAGLALLSRSGAANNAEILVPRPGSAPG